MTGEEKLLGAVALGGLALYIATRKAPKAHGGLEGTSAPSTCAAQLAAVRAQYAALSATGRHAQAQGLLPAIAALEKQCGETKPTGPVNAVVGLVDDPTICLRWKTGNAKIPWGAPQYAKIDSAINAALEQHFRDYASIEEAQQVAFEVTRSAIKSVCPSVPVPALLTQVDEYKKNVDLGFWWDDLWNYFWQGAWTKVVEMGGGSL